MESIYIGRVENIVVPENEVMLGDKVVDRVSLKIWEKAGGDEQLKPVSVMGDGNCLFNALSVACVGDESAATELRLRTCIEMVNNEEYYTEYHRGRRTINPGIISDTSEFACFYLNAC
ncbi:vertnin-like [Saccoglossus kowalevskii]